MNDKSKTSEYKDGFEVGILTLSELLLESLKIGCAMGFGKTIPIDIMEQFIKRYAVELMDGKTDMPTLKAVIKEAADMAIDLINNKGQVH